MRYDTVNFTNITNEVFEAQYDGEVYSVKPGETKTYPDFLGKHMAKHLINRVILDTEQDRLNDEELRREYAEKILGVTEPAPPEEEKSEGEALKEEVEELQVDEEESEEEEEEAFANVPDEIEEREEIKEEVLSELSKDGLIDKAKKAGVYKEDMDKEELVEVVKDL